MNAPVTMMDPVEQRAADGHPAAFGELLRRHDRHARAVVWSVVRDRAALDDVLQSAYEKAFRSIDSFRGDAAFSTWLHSICHRTAIDHVRHERIRRHDDIDDLRGTASSSSTSGAALARVELAAALERLDPDTRSMLIMTTALDMSYDEVAEITGTPRGTVASRVGRARAALRQEFER